MMYVDATAFVRDKISGLERYSLELLTAACKIRPNLESQLTFLAFIGDDLSQINKHFPAAKTVKLPLPRKVYSQFYKYAWPLHSWFQLSKPAIYTNFFQFPFLSKKAVVIVHDLAYVDYPSVVQPRNRWALSRLIPRSLERDGVVAVAVSTFTARRMSKEYDLSSEPQVVANAVDSERFRRPSIISRELYSLPDTYILFLGTVEPRKNLLNLVKACQLLSSDVKEKFPLVIAGRKGWQNEELTNAVTAARAEGVRIIETGYIADEDLPGLYQQARVFVFLSDYEGTGLPVLEAMAAGTPVLASDIPPHRDIGSDTITFVDQTSPEKVAKKLEHLLRNPLSASQLETARRQAAKQSWQASAKQLLKILDKLELE